jgi:hypothetical protein
MSRSCVHTVKTDGAIDIEELSGRRVRVHLTDLVLEGDPRQMADVLFAVASILTEELPGTPPGTYELRGESSSRLGVSRMRSRR